MHKLVLVLLLSLVAGAQERHPVLPLGSAAPDFALPGVDGKIHRLSDYAASPVLAVVFLCNHCPIAQMYEARIQQLADDYRARGVAVVAIEPNDPKAIRIDELDSSDVSDSLAEMKVRVSYKHLRYPYLYDGDTQEVVRAYGPQATPHIFIFDAQRRLRYEGRVDDSYRTELVKTQDARNAIDALLGHMPVPVTHTGVFGCSTKWSEKATGSAAALHQLEEQPVSLDSASRGQLEELRTNPSHQVMLIEFWGLDCATCESQFAEMEDTLRMYADRDFSLVTVSVNRLEDRERVLKFLQERHATSTNLMAGWEDGTAVLKTFDPKWDSQAPYTVLLSADGKVLYRKRGAVDVLELRRTILANVPVAYAGFRRYWTTN